ncbi:MAG TPA: ATP-dependent DNA ligase [Acidobacteriaceae bacterium]|nr:ATP-dependent DNA ligase [Acidobacteriaceae bacterium]
MSSFLPFAELCDALAATTKKLEKRALIATYLQSLPVDDAGRAALWLSGTPFPETDPRVLNIGGALLQKTVLQLAGTNAHALGAAYRRHGDIGAAAADLLYGHAPAVATLTLADVESALTALAEARGPAPKLRLLIDLLSRATPEEAKYLIKLATGDMRTGVKQSLVEEAIAEAWPPSSEASTKTPPAAAVRRASMLLGSLREVVTLAAAGRLADARMKLFHPIGFMLASPVQSVDEAIARFTEEIAEEVDAAEHPSNKEAASNQKSSVILSEASESLRPLLRSRESNGPAVQSAPPAKPASESLVSGHDFSRAVKDAKKIRALAPEAPLRAAQLEDKFDGIRAQLHVSGARVALYSRNREDLSAGFPELVEAFSTIQETAILDGEILAWNPATQRALSFSALQQRLGRKRVTAEMRRDIPIVLVVFDLLYRNGNLLLEHPLAERRRQLEDFSARWSPATADFEATGQSSLFSERAQQAFPRLILASATRFETAEQLDQAYVDARARGNEGVMIKSLASTYQPGRRGLAWLKLKRELATLDVVVTGVEYGNGRRAHVLSDYTFAIRDPEDPDAPLKNVGKAYSGLTDQEIADMTAWFKSHTLEDYGHFRTVEPTVVLEVAFNNVMRSSRHASGFALRFPRILRIRTDKPVAEIDALERVEEIYNSQPDRPIDDRSDS